MNRNIIHLDMDAFYASVEVLDDPALKGQPVIVGGGGDRGVVSAASYEARKFGIHSAMPWVTAKKRCPHGKFLPVRMSRYRAVSDRIFAIFQRFTPLVEPLSLDEAFLDVTGSSLLYGAPPTIAARIRELVRREIGLTVSAGVAASKLVAKIASDQNKPDGLTIVAPGTEGEFLAPLPIRRLWGVGKTTGKTLAMLGIRTIGDLRRLPEEMLERKFGQPGRSLYLAARGLDDREVETDRGMKSVGHEETFEHDLLDRSLIDRELLALAVRVGRRLRRHGLTGRTVTLKVKYHDFVQITRSQTIQEATDDGREIHRCARALLAKTPTAVKAIRLLGISLSQFNHTGQRQGSLFQDRGEGEKRQQINRAVDRITEKYGATAILPAGLLGE